MKIAKILIGLVSFSSANVVISIDDKKLSGVAGGYAKWAESESETAEAQQLANELASAYKKASMRIAVNQGKVLKPVADDL